MNYYHRGNRNYLRDKWHKLIGYMTECHARELYLCKSMDILGFNEYNTIIRDLCGPVFTNLVKLSLSRILLMKGRIKLRASKV